ncbi:hypothetical protein APHAL10511_006935 [Amanita phalloides]|nr:hypothetical protein APHAL10511_006935 [Amanita phalloides]
MPSDSSNNLQQTSLDASILRVPKQPPFSTVGLLDYIVEFIVHEDGAFQLVEHDSFRQLLHFCCLTLTDKDIPNRKCLHDEVIQHASHTKALLQEKLKTHPSKISFTFDLWTSDSSDPYISITGHYINTPTDRLHDWELRTEQLAFKHV